MLNSTENIQDAQILAQAIVNTIPEPFLVLDDKFHVLAASRSFCATFKVDPEQTRDCLLYDLGNGRWDIPALRVLLETIIPEKASMDGFEVAHSPVSDKDDAPERPEGHLRRQPQCNDPAGLQRRHGAPGD